MSYPGSFDDLGTIMLAGSIPRARLAAAVSRMLAVPPHHVLDREDIGERGPTDWCDSTAACDLTDAHFERGHARIRRFSHGEFRTWVEPFVPHGRRFEPDHDDTDRCDTDRHDTDRCDTVKGPRDLAPRLHALSRACRTIVCVDSQNGDPHDPFLADAFVLGLRVNGIGIDETGGCECAECAVGGDPGIPCLGGKDHACPTLTGPRWFRPLVRTMGWIASR